MRPLLLSILFLFLAAPAFSHEGDKVQYEYLNIRVQYGKKMQGYVYEVYLDIGTSGKHSLSGTVTNDDGKVQIKDEYGMQEFSSDIDLVNYLGKLGWTVQAFQQIQILSEPWYVYTMYRVVDK